MARAERPPMTAPTCVWPLGARLGEGPVWDASSASLWFVDIKASVIYRYTPHTGRKARWKAPQTPGFVAPCVGGAWIAGLRSGLHRFSPSNGAFTPLLTVEDPDLGNRLNDSHVDAAGRLWFGSMHDAETAPSGALYRFDGETLARCDEDYVVTNGPATSPDGRILYHTDTVERTVYAFDLDAAGRPTERRRLIQIEAGAGYPDGTTVDADGCLWIGLFGGWAARRYSPLGVLLQTVEFPVANVTKIALGGPDLRTAYATTAVVGLDRPSLRRQPLAGGLFRFAVETPGLRQARFNG